MNGKRALPSVVFAGLMIALAMPARAQWTAAGYGVAEYDTQETLLLLAGISAGLKGGSITPRAGIQAYHLSYDAGTSRTNVMVVKPSVGLGMGLAGGSAHAMIGYAFSDKDTPVPAVVGAETGSGTVLSGGWERTGTGLGFQGLASYNFGSENFWTRGRVTTPMGGGSTRIGAEVAYLSGTGFSLWQPGGVMLWQTASGKSFGIGAGVKIPDAGDNAVYFKLEGGIPLIR
jgi:hypothetical protein